MAIAQMDEIRKMFAERVHVEKIDDNKSLKDLGLDSLDVVEMCLDLEDKYGIQFSTDELSGFKTVGDLLASIEKKLAAKK
jgi:acyl carrier protein